MNWRYDDRDPISERINEHIENSAAVRMMERNSKKKYADKPPLTVTPKQYTTIIIVCLVALYLISMLLATNFVMKEYEERYEKNAESVLRYLAISMDEDTNYLNYFYDLEVTQEDYQQFSAALYNEEGNCQAVTQDYLCVQVDEKYYHFPLKEYFDETEIIKIYAYTRAVTKRYKVVAEIDTEKDTLVRLVFYPSGTASKGEAVWEWKNKKATNVREDVLKSGSMLKRIGEIVSAPYFAWTEERDRWQEDEFLQSVGQGIDFDKEPYAMKVGEEKMLVVRESSRPLAAAIDTLSPAYTFGIVVMLLGIYATVCLQKKIRK